MDQRPFISGRIEKSPIPKITHVITDLRLGNSPVHARNHPAPDTEEPPNEAPLPDAGEGSSSLSLSHKTGL